MSWKAVAHWLTGSIMLFTAVVTATMAKGDTMLFGWMISLLLFLIGGLFWITAGKAVIAKELQEIARPPFPEED